MNEDLEAVADCLRSGWLTMGPRTKAFEEALAAFTAAPHAIAVSSGTAALQLACAALRLGPGDEVIVPAFTFAATAHAVRFVGATPVLCDVLSPQAPHIDAADAERRITPRTRAVIAVHVFGHPADLTALQALCDAHGLVLIEDAAQAFGADGVGTALTCLSFGAGKQLEVGAGGMVLTADEALAARARLLRSHAMTSGTWDRHRGHASSYDVVDIGFNFRLDEPRAALGLARLPRVPAEVERRRAAARAARAALTDGTPMFALDGASPVAFPVLFDAPPTGGRRYPALHELSAFAGLAAPGSLPRAEDAARRHLAFPLR